MSALLEAKKQQFAFVCNRCASDSKSIGQYIVGGVGTDSICSWCAASLTSIAYTDDVLEPFIGQHGQMTSSSSLTIELSRRFIYDVNGYYRELGVSPHASKAELRQAYQESIQDDRLTYIAKVLLDNETRIQYDLLKIGQLWFDPWLSARVREEMLDEVQGQDIAEEGEVTVRQDLLEREDQPINISPAEETWSPSAWGHYTWHIGPRTWLMARWRLMLSLAARELGMTIPDLMVGVMRGEQPWAVYRLSAGRTIFFLEEHAVASTELARAAIVSVAT
jgi:hypothetical protein